MKKLTSAVVASSLVFGLVGTAFANYSAESVTKAAVRMQTLGLIQGVPKPDGSLDLVLNEKLTRAQLVTVIVRAWGQSETAKLLVGADSFPDTKNHPWASGEIALAKNIAAQNGFTLGYPDGTFKPEGTVTAAEAIALTNKFLGIKPTAGLAWPMGDIQGALDAGIITADDKNTLSALPNIEANRGLAFYLADRAFSVYKLPNGKTVYTTYVDTTAPTVTVDSYTASTDKASITLTGTASGHTVLHVGYTGADVVTAKADGTWSANVTLKAGANDIWVHALDIAGNATEVKNVKVTRVAGAATKVEAELSSALLKAGSTADLTVVVSDAAGTEIKDAVLDVTVEGEIGTYDAATGKFTAASKPATGKIMISSGAAPAVSLDVAVVAGDLKTISIEGGASAKIGQPLTFTAKGADASGNTVAVTGVTWSTSTGGVINPTTGEFAGTASGNVTITATAGDVNSTATVAIYGDAAALAVTAPTGLVANNKSTGTLQVKVVDAGGAVVTNSAATVNVAFPTASGIKFVTNPTTLTTSTSNSAVAVNGVATFTVISDIFTVSTQTVSATSGTLTGALASVTTVAPVVASINLAVSPSGSVFESTGSVNIKASLVDASGATLPAPAAIAITIANGNTSSATLAGTSLNFANAATAVSENAGAGVALTLLGVQGDITISGTATGYTVNPVTFSTRLAGSSTKLVLTTAPVDVSADTGTFTVKYAIQDNLGTTKTNATIGGTNTVATKATHSDGTTIINGTNAVAGGIVTASFAGATKAGVWTFTASGTDVGTAAALAAPASATATVTAGVPAALASLKVNATATAPVVGFNDPYTLVANGSQTASITVNVVDAAGNLVTTANNSVTFARTANTFTTLPSAMTVNAVNGVAGIIITAGITDSVAAYDSFTVTGVKDATAATNLTVNASALGARVATQIVGMPANVAVMTAPVGATAGTAFDVSFKIIDAGLRPVTTDNGRAASLQILKDGTAVTTLQGTTVNGVAKFSVNLTAAGVAAYEYKVTTNINGVDKPISYLAQTVAPAAATKVLVTSALSSVEGGSAIAVNVSPKDDYGNTTADAVTGIVYTVNGILETDNINNVWLVTAGGNARTFNARNTVESVVIADSDAKATIGTNTAIPVTSATVSSYLASGAFKLGLNETPAAQTAPGTVTIKVGVYDGNGVLKTAVTAVPAGFSLTTTGTPPVAPTIGAATAANGVVSVVVSGMTKSGTYTFTAAATGLVPVTGITASVNAAAATTVTPAAPTTMIANGSAIQVLTFNVVDGQGNTDTTYNGTMTFTVLAGSVGAGLLSTSAPIVGGQAQVQIKATTTSGTFTVIPAISGSPAAITTYNNAVVNVQSGAPSAANSSASLSTGTVFFILRDANNNGITMASTSVVALSVKLSDGTTDTAMTEVGNGVYSLTKGTNTTIKVMDGATVLFSATAPN